MIKDVAKSFWSFFDNIRGHEALGLNEVVGCTLILYCRHKGYSYDFYYFPEKKIQINCLGDNHKSDETLTLLYTRIRGRKLSGYVVKFADFISSITNEDFTEQYPSIVDYYYEKVGRLVGGSDSVYFIQPREVTELISFFLQKYGVTSIYNPFAGLCSYPISLGGKCKFVAQEINKITLALAKVRLDAYGLNSECVEYGDSIRQWEDPLADSIVSSVPFGLTFSAEERKELKIPFLYYDEFFFYKALDINHDNIHFPKKCIATIVARNFCYRDSSKIIREYLCKGKSIDTIIELPEGVFPGTSIATSIIILSEEHKTETVRFVDAMSFFPVKGQSDLWTDTVDKLLSVIKEDSSDFIKHVSYSEITDQSYILCGDNYLADNYVCNDGKQVVRLGDIAWCMSDFPIVWDEVNVLDESGFSNKVLDIIHPDTTCLSRQHLRTMDGNCHVGSCLIFALIDGEVKVYNYKSDIPIFVKMRYLCLNVNEGVTPEYLALTLLQDPIFCRQFKQRGNMSRLSNIILNRNIVIDIPSHQEHRLRLAEQKEKEAMARTRAAEDARYQINKAGSDIAHMLGSAFKKQKEIIGEFRYLNPGSTDYQNNVTSLIDTAQYVNRVITAVGKDLSKARISLKRTNISLEVEDYVRAWGNFNGTSDFEILVHDFTYGDVQVKLDSLMFRIMMDTLIDNAWRHGFNQGNIVNEEGNKIAIRLMPVIIDENSYVLVSVMNNGQPLDADYRVRDYIERGNFKGDSGRTGLGGHHVYTIVKRHNGFFSINSEKGWSFVANILLPVEDSGKTIFNTEYDGEYV